MTTAGPGSCARVPGGGSLDSAEICPRCGAANRDGARFCDSCAAALSEPLLVAEQRKTVTVLFCDVAGSTALGESLDPEALRLVLARYFERMRTIVEYHGGTVEKFIGDAVMAVFGVPVLHEDDALRDVRRRDLLVRHRSGRLRARERHADGDRAGPDGGFDPATPRVARSSRAAGDGSRSAARTSSSRRRRCTQASGPRREPRRTRGGASSPAWSTLDTSRATPPAAPAGG